MPERLVKLKTVLWMLVGVLAAVSVVRFMYGLGAVTNLSDAAPWGLWIGFDVMSGVALAAGGFVLTAAVYVFGLERYRPFVRAAVLTALLGYAAVAVGLLYDLGLPWHIWHPLVHWQIHSVLFEVAACVMLYLTVLALEFAPVVLEHPWFDRPLFRTVLRVLKKVSIVLVIAGIVLSTLHQSSLGSLFLITPYRLHPLWYSHLIYVQFFISAVALGLMTVVLEALFSSYFLGHQVHARELAGLGLAAAVVLWIYVALRLGDLARRGLIGTALDGSWQANLFLFELALSAVVPATLLLFRRVRERVAGVAAAATMVVAGIVLHRIDVSIIAFARPEGMGYVPTWEEVAVSLGIVAGAALIFLFFAEHFRVFDDVDGPLDRPRFGYDPASVRGFLNAPGALTRRYSFAFLSALVAALLFLPLGGPRDPSAPVAAVRHVDGRVLDPGRGGRRVLTLAGVPPNGAAPSGGEARLLVLIDGNRDGEPVLFDHAEHEKRLGGDASCGTCHHLNLPLDESSSCSSCHRDMYAPTVVFDHASHEAATGGNDGCAECHPVEARVKSYDTATPCAACHEAEPLARRIIPPAAERWGPAAGYMDAMHGLCVTCHEEELADASGEHPEDLARCATCHDPDRRHRLDELRPRNRTGAAVAERPAETPPIPAGASW